MLQRVRAGKLSHLAACKITGDAIGRVRKTTALLQELGDTDEHLPLAARFRRTAGRLEDIGMDKATTEVYGRLTLAMHDLSFLLSEEFYPGP